MTLAGVPANSPEADEYGVVLPPTVIVGDFIVAADNARFCDTHGNAVDNYGSRDELEYFAQVTNALAFERVKISVEEAREQGYVPGVAGPFVDDLPDLDPIHPGSHRGTIDAIDRLILEVFDLPVNIRVDLEKDLPFICHGNLRSAVYRLATALGLVVTVNRCADGRLKVVRVL